MPVELVTIDRVPTIFPGRTDPVERFISREITSTHDIRMLRIDQRIRVGIPMGRQRRSLPVFAECRNEGEFPKLMAAVVPDYRRGWASGVLRIHNDMLQSADFVFPIGADRKLAAYIHLIYDHISPAVVVPPYHEITVNRRIRFGFVPADSALEQYYPSD